MKQNTFIGVMVIESTFAVLCADSEERNGFAILLPLGFNGRETPSF